MSKLPFLSLFLVVPIVFFYALYLVDDASPLSEEYQVDEVEYLVSSSLAPPADTENWRPTKLPFDLGNAPGLTPSIWFRLKLQPGDYRLEQLCSEVLEPIQQRFGRISIRSGYRSPAVNARGAENNNQYNCASNEKNYGAHIWDYDRPNGSRGATACIVINSAIPYYEATDDWQSLAWWILDNVDGYSKMYFFPKLAAFNINWSSEPVKRIDSYIHPKGCLTKPGDANHSGSHADLYRPLLDSLNLTA